MTERDRVKHLQDTLVEMEHLMNRFFEETDEWLRREKCKLNSAYGTAIMKSNTMEVTENDLITLKEGL